MNKVKKLVKYVTAGISRAVHNMFVAQKFGAVMLLSFMLSTLLSLAMVLVVLLSMVVWPSNVVSLRRHIMEASSACANLLNTLYEVASNE